MYIHICSFNKFQTADALLGAGSDIRGGQRALHARVPGLPNSGDTTPRMMTGVTLHSPVHYKEI